MVDLQDFMCKYIQEQTQALKGCLIAVLNSKGQYLSLLDESLGTSTRSEDIKMCELLVDSGLFREEIKLTRDGRNRYKVFYLTPRGVEMAEKIKVEGYSGKLPESTPIDNM